MTQQQVKQVKTDASRFVALYRGMASYTEINHIKETEGQMTKAEREHLAKFIYV